MDLKNVVIVHEGKQEAMNRTFKMEPLKDKMAYRRIINLKGKLLRDGCGST